MIDQLIELLLFFHRYWWYILSILF